MEYDKYTGELNKWHVQPIAAYHNNFYMSKNKGECDKQVVNSLDDIPYGEMPKWGRTALFLINSKQNLGLGVSKNGISRRVGKKN